MSKKCECPLCRSGRWLAVAALALAACGQAAPELTPFERAAVHAGRAGWIAAGLPASEGNCDFTKLTIRRPDANEFALTCGGYPWACTRYDTSAFGGRRYPVIVLRPGLQLDAQGEPIPHEVQHQSWRCSGMAGADGAGNMEHLDARVWSAAEAAPGTSAQGRARALMAAP